jgi:sterol desaturase/sphingolipid hydroxylase (fatty acid hydroxylase superfamily)
MSDLREDAFVTYMPDHLTKNARTDSRQRKLLRGLRLYLFGPTVFVAMMLAFDSILLSAITSAICLSISHADLERRSPYLAGLEQSPFAYWRQFAAANVPAVAYTVVGVFAGHSFISVIREAIGFDPSLAGVFGIATPADAPAATLLQLSLPIICLSDLFIYLYHRSAHKSAGSIRWRLHRVHHSIPHFSLHLGARAHPIETIVTYTLCGIAGGLLGLGLPASFCAGVLIAFRTRTVVRIIRDDGSTPMASQHRPIRFGQLQPAPSILGSNIGYAS